jgi:dipeptidyl aminopeptidase/acylaminoacyl peptidase
METSVTRLMNMARILPYGTWASPLPAAAVAAQGLRYGGVAIDGDDVYWIEGRPQEAGRNVIVCRTAAGAVADVIPPGFNARTRVHEYGGGAYVVSGGDVYFSNFSDQRIYRTSRFDARPVPITPEGQWFYADAAVDARRRRLICVREDHTAPGEPVNALVSVAMDGSAVQLLTAGYDFYSTPRLSPDGARLCWLAWRHPNMPWDGTELWLADVTDAGTLANSRQVAGGETESIYQPGWSPDGQLYFVSDRDGWWKLYRSEDLGRSTRPVLAETPEGAEFGRPQWVFGTATWAFAERDRLVVAYTRRGRWHLATVDVPSGAWHDLAPGLEPHDWLAAAPGRAVLVAGSPTMADAVVEVNLQTGEPVVVRASSTLQLDPADVSVGEAIEFPAGNGSTAHAFYYAPASRTHAAPADTRPPLMAISHGGPTTATTATLDLRIQYWTSRGFAVVDVNYGGSSGYGRPYRERLAGQWGITDVADMINAVRYLVGEGKADPHRLIIRGGSAGGYTTLAALTFQAGVFTAGASYYGVSDLEVLARDTHKFEARYLDKLIGPYPASQEVYRARSPIHFVDHLACPLILFQGLDDKVVPPNQSQMMADAARAKRLPVAYLTFEGEQHGFRKAETIVRSLEAELYFYGAVFGFTPADPIEPVLIDNLSLWRTHETS